MRVTLVHSEIQAAVVDMLEKRGVKIEGTDIAVAFSMGRKNTGLSATVDIVDPSIVELPAAVVDEEDQPAVESKETKEVKNTFVAKADDVGDIAVAKEEPKETPVATTEEDPPFEVDEVAAPAASTTSSEEPKKTTQSLFAQ